ncbi:AraC family transcriptional regulator [Winogradskya consettensis]|uniref:AraC family transcriptional regulator n=1 Tax=Winogradskya consettensis TaxID=113560 RepID=A0A919W137_9ACTN|nr:AraC family transcriptional regulator [Actinoplanes consettensis]GIM85296.1 AraC family transcriptional regulator [Actinoplanes consettensis]
MDMISEAVARTRAGRAVAVRNRYTGSWATRFPAINGSGLHIVRQGTPWLIPEHTPPVALQPGSIVFIPHGPPHGFSNTPIAFTALPALREPPPDPDRYDVEFVSCCYHLDRGQIHESLNGLPEVITLLHDDRHPALQALTALLGEHAADTQPGSDLALPAVVDLLLIHLLRLWHEQNGSTADPAATDPRIAQALRNVELDPHKPWTVQQLSDAAHMSRATFTREFTQATGEKPGAWLTRRRLDRGAHLLRRTDLPLGSIALQLGYATEFSFSAAFRRVFGLAPGRFRDRERAQ